MARMMTRLGTTPETMNPPMPTRSPPSTCMRVEKLTACAGGLIPGVGLGVVGGVGVGVPVGGVTVGVGVATGGVGVGVVNGGVGVGVVGGMDGLGVGLGLVQAPPPKIRIVFTCVAALS